MDTDLSVGVLEVIFHGLLGYVTPLGDFFVRKPLEGQTDYFSLARGKVIACQTPPETLSQH